MRLRHINKGYRALLTDPAVSRDLRARAERIAQAAGGYADGYTAVVTENPRKRARAAVVANFGDSSNRMIHSLDAGR